MHCYCCYFIVAVLLFVWQVHLHTHTRAVLEIRNHNFGPFHSMSLRVGLVVVAIVLFVFLFTLLIPRLLKYLLHSCYSVLRPLRAVKKRALLLLFKKLMSLKAIFWFLALQAILWGWSIYVLARVCADVNRKRLGLAKSFLICGFAI